MLFLIINSCILFSSAEISLVGDNVLDSAQGADPVMDSADLSTDRDIADEMVMPSHLKFYDFPPSTPFSSLVVESHELIVDDPLGCSGLNENDENLLYNYYEYQVQTVPVPENLSTLEVDIVSSHAVFDDQIVVTINNNMVYTSDLSIPIMLSNPFDFQWEEIIHQPMNAFFEPECLIGCNESYDNLEPPGITYEGSILVSFLSQDLMTFMGSNPQMEIGIYVFGDNDAIDCTVQNIQVNIRFGVFE